MKTLIMLFIITVSSSIYSFEFDHENLTGMKFCSANSHCIEFEKDTKVYESVKGQSSDYLERKAYKHLGYTTSQLKEILVRKDDKTFTLLYKLFVSGEGYYIESAQDGTRYDHKNPKAGICNIDPVSCM